MYIFCVLFFYRFVLFSIFDWSICTLFFELHVTNVSIRCITNIMVFELMNSLFQAPIDKINIFFPMFKWCRVFYLFFGMMLMMMMMADDVKNRYGGLCSPPQIITSSNKKNTCNPRGNTWNMYVVQPNHTYIFARNHPPYSTTCLLKCTFYSKHALYDINWR